MRSGRSIMNAHMIYKTEENLIFTRQKDNLSFFFNMSSNDDLPKKGKKKKIMRDIFGRKRQRMNESSDDEQEAENVSEKYDAEDLMNLIDSGDNREYRSLPVNHNLTDEAGVPVDFEELVSNGKPMSFVQCKTLNCPSKKDLKVRYGHFNPHAIDTKNNRTRLYQ